MRRATGELPQDFPTYEISIHALLAESDYKIWICWNCLLNFYPRSPCGERRICQNTPVDGSGFLSTLSLRRATISVISPASRLSDFYPRSPCGERPFQVSTGCRPYDFYPRSPCGERQGDSCFFHHCIDISIHALLAESDMTGIRMQALIFYFYPRSPCGERHSL